MARNLWESCWLDKQVLTFNEETAESSSQEGKQCSKRKIRFWAFEERTWVLSKTGQEYSWRQSCF